MDQAHIRNFSIIAHIDHGKSTLADRILELTHTVARARHARAGARLDGPRARARASRSRRRRCACSTRPRDGETYQLHLIDTPGPRRLHLRGLALAGGVRGRAAGRRRLAGRRGPDARQHLPGGRVGARADPVPEQDRPARGPSPSAWPARSRDLIGEPPEAILQISGKTGEGVERGARAARRARAAAGGRPRRPRRGR